MTAYFDQLQHEISEASTSYRGFDNSDMMFLLLVAKVEARAIRAARAVAELPVSRNRSTWRSRSPATAVRSTKRTWRRRG